MASAAVVSAAALSTALITAPPHAILDLATLLPIAAVHPTPLEARRPTAAPASMTRVARTRPAPTTHRLVTVARRRAMTQTTALLQSTARLTLTRPPAPVPLAKLVSLMRCLAPRRRELPNSPPTAACL